MAKREVEVDGKRYRVTDNIGYQPSAGVYAKAVDVEGAEMVIVARKRGGPWVFWAERNRIGAE